MVFSRIFMVSRLIFKTFIHLEFIFVYGVSWWLSFIFLACSCPDLPTPFVEESIFTPFYASSPFVEYQLTIDIGFMSGLSMLFHWSMCLFLCQYQAVLIIVAL